jgi:hypothetical protein
VCKAVQQMLLATLTLLTLQQQQIAQLSARVADLEARLNQAFAECVQTTVV